MGSTAQQFCLKWNNHQANMLTVFERLLGSKSLVDVTLGCEGRQVKAHKVVLSACSPFFEGLFTENPCKHPIVILKDIRYADLKALVEFMYKGEVNVVQEQLPTLLKTAEALKIKGLAEVTGESKDDVAASGSVGGGGSGSGGGNNHQHHHVPSRQGGSNNNSSSSNNIMGGSSQRSESPGSRRKRQRARRRSTDSMAGVGLGIGGGGSGSLGGGGGGGGGSVIGLGGGGGGLSDSEESLAKMSRTDMPLQHHQLQLQQHHHLHDESSMDDDVSSHDDGSQASLQQQQHKKESASSLPSVQSGASLGGVNVDSTSSPAPASAGSGKSSRNESSSAATGAAAASTGAGGGGGSTSGGSSNSSSSSGNNNSNNNGSSSKQQPSSAVTSNANGQIPSSKDSASDFEPSRLLEASMTTDHGAEDSNDNMNNSTGQDNMSANNELDIKPLITLDEGGATPAGSIVPASVAAAAALAGADALSSLFPQGASAAAALAGTSFQNSPPSHVKSSNAALPSSPVSSSTSSTNPAVVIPAAIAASAIVPASSAMIAPIPLVVMSDRERDVSDTPPPSAPTLSGLGMLALPPPMPPSSTTPTSTPTTPVTAGSTFIPPELMRQLFDHIKQEYVCPFCLWTTPDEEKVQGHIASHTGEPQKDRDSKRYRCRFCPFASKQKGNLLRHERIHTGEKPYACDLCDYKSHRGDKITAHKLTIHKVATPAVHPGSPLSASLGLLAITQFGSNNNDHSESSNHHHSPPAII